MPNFLRRGWLLVRGIVLYYTSGVYLDHRTWQRLGHLGHDFFCDMVYKHDLTVWDSHFAIPYCLIGFCSRRDFDFARSLNKDDRPRYVEFVYLGDGLWASGVTGDVTRFTVGLYREHHDQFLLA